METNKRIPSGYEFKFIDEVNDSLQYVGYAKYGDNDLDNGVWVIYKITKSGTVTKMLKAYGSWNKRNTLNYM